MQKGFFVSLEGTEGSGKTTQIKLLSDYLNKKKMKFIITQEPGSTKISDKIKEILMDPEYKNMHYLTELFLYIASRIQHVHEVIAPALSKGNIVICDRYLDSTVAYQCYGRGVNRKLIDNLNRIATFNLKPDLTFIIDIPVEQGLERAKKIKKKFSEGNGDRLEQEKIEFHNRVWKGYKKIAISNPKRVRIIDGTNSKEEVFKNIKHEFEKKIKEIDYATK